MKFSKHASRIWRLRSLLDILRDPVKEFKKAALSSRDLETARQLALIELAALVCWKAPHVNHEDRDR